MPKSEFIWMGNSGCLLPFLIIINFLFGRFIFDSTRVWLGIEVALILLFILKFSILAHKINKQFGAQGSRASNKNYRSKGSVIDVQGQVIEDDNKLK